MTNVDLLSQTDYILKNNNRMNQSKFFDWNRMKGPEIQNLSLN